MVHGDVVGAEDVAVRLHSECLTGDVMGSLRCDCRDQLTEGLRAIQREGRGVLLYLRQEGRGIGLLNKIRAYALQEQGLDTVEANLALGLPSEAREYGAAIAILNDLGVKSVRLMTNNPEKSGSLTAAGIPVTEYVPVIVGQGADNAGYLETKREKMGHLIPEGVKK